MFLSVQFILSLFAGQIITTDNHYAFSLSLRNRYHTSVIATEATAKYEVITPHVTKFRIRATEPRPGAPVGEKPVIVTFFDDDRNDVAEYVQVNDDKLIPTTDDQSVQRKYLEILKYVATQNKG